MQWRENVSVWLWMLFAFSARVTPCWFQFNASSQNQMTNVISGYSGKDFKIMCKSQKTDYMKNYFRFNIRIKVSTIAFSQPSISDSGSIFRVSSFLIRTRLYSSVFLLSLPLNFHLLYPAFSILLWRLCLSISFGVFGFFFVVWTFYTVTQDEYPHEKSSPQLFKIFSARTDCWVWNRKHFVYSS